MQKISIIKFIFSYAAILIIVCSSIFNIIYFWTINLSTTDIPLNWSDLLNSALLWTPGALIIVVFMLLFVIMLENSTRLKNKLKKYSSNKKATKKFHGNFWYIYISLTILSAVLFLICLYRNDYLSCLLAAPLTLCTLWFLIIFRPVSKIILDKDKYTKDQKTYMTALWILPIAFLIPYLSGYVRGYTDITQTNPDFEVAIKYSGRIKAINFRSFDKGILIKNTDTKSLEFIPWESITSLKSLRKQAKQQKS